MRVNGQTRTVEMYRVTTEAEPLVLALAYQGMMNIFVDPTDTTVSAFAFSRLATPVEHITFEWQNYEEVLGLGLGQVFINTVIVTVGVVGGQLLTSIMGGYAFARLTFVGRSRLFLLYLGSIMIPFVVLIVPLYRLMIWLGWQGELVALIIPWMFTAYGTFLMRQAFLTIPADLEDAARMDGANRWRILWSILVPLSKPAIATLAVFSFLYAWNSFLWPLLIIGQGNADSHVLTLALSRLNAAYDQRPNLVMAGAVITILPPLVVFLLAQKYFIEGFATSGIKG
jgi:multiple sugar transport system permease protein